MLPASLGVPRPPQISKCRYHVNLHMDKIKAFFFKDVLFAARNPHKPRSWVSVFLEIHPQCHKLGSLCNRKIETEAENAKFGDRPEERLRVCTSSKLDAAVESSARV